jgi:phospholipid/cholesterol/gamma-HCH transport system substrate-binding protein
MKASMQRRWERVRTVPGLGRDVTAVAVLIVAALIATAILQNRMAITFPWSDRTHLQVEFESVPGVNPKSSHKVTMAGVTVGKITGWKPTSKGTAVLDLEIESGHTFYSNARAVLRPKNPLNDMTVEINPGSAPGKALKENGRIPLSQTERPVQVDEILGKLDERTQLAVTDLLVQSDVALVRAPKELPSGLKAADSTLLKLEPVVTSLKTRRAKIAKLVTALSDISGALGRNDARTAKLVNATQDTLSVLGKNDGDLRSTLDQLPGLSSELRKALSSTQRLTGELDPAIDGLGAASKDLPDALDRLDSTVDKVGSTVDKAKPFIAMAKPVVADLRPIVANVDPALTDLLPVTASLNQDTATVTKYMDDIRAFVYNTSSVFGAGEGPETGIIRGHLVVPLAGAGAIPGLNGGYAPGKENGIGGGN